MIGFFTKNNNEINGEWRIVADLKVGQKIAVPKTQVLERHNSSQPSFVSRERELRQEDNDILWDEIESIELVGTEQVWDIEVEGTHNFVGNNIFAHNTYITGGNLGVGTSSPYANISVGGQAVGSTLLAADALSGQTAPIVDIKLASTSKFIIDSTGNVGIGTSTPQWLLNPSSATASQLALSVGGGINQWAFRNAGGNLYFSTTTIDGAATTSISALEISGAGFGTTTVRGLNILGQATSTSNVGFNITTGCYSVNGTCVGGGGVTSLTGNALTKGYLLVGNDADLSQATSSVFISSVGNFGVGTVAPSALLSLQGAGTAKDLLSIASTTNGISVITITQWGGFVQRIASTSAMSIQMASGTPVFEIDTTSSNTNAGMDITAATGQTANLLNLYSSGGTFLSGFTASGGLWMNLASTTALNMYDGSGGSAFVVDSTNKNVGIGTSTLAYALTVQGNQSANYIARIDNANTGTDADGLLITLGVANASRTTSNYFIGFATGDKTVAGKIQGGASAVAYTTTAADLAEYFRISDLNNKPEAGEIVMLDRTKNNSILKGGSNDESEPFGIVSTNPGFIGNGPICFAEDNNCDKNYAEYNVLVSIAGQVPVKISNENGIIKAGDYLTLSTTTPGVAVKMIKSGYTIGVALSEATTTDMFGKQQTPMVNTFIKNGWREIGAGSLATNENGVQIPGVWNSLFNFFKSFGLEIGNGFIKIANLVTEKIISNKVETKELCIDGVCVNKEQLAALLLNSGIPQTSTTASSNTSLTPSSTATSSPAASTSSTAISTSMPLITATSTPPAVISSTEATTTIPTIAPEPTPEPISTMTPTPVAESSSIAPITAVDSPEVVSVVELAPATETLLIQ